MKNRWFVLLSILLVLPSVFSDSVDEEVELLLDTQEEIEVIIVLEEDTSMGSLSESDMTLEDKKEMVAQQQEQLLESIEDHIEESQNVSPEDFVVGKQFSTISALTASITEESLELLEQQEEIKYIYPNREVNVALDDIVHTMNASSSWKFIYGGQNITGHDQVICVIDTGVDYTHSDMGDCESTTNINDGSCAKVIGGYDFINSDENPIDDHGHGTHVAGIIASTNQTYRGIAPDARIVAIKSLNSGGGGTTQNVIDGIDWCVANSSHFNITIISMSLGTDTLFTSLCDANDPGTSAAVNAAAALNISVFAASGNDASTTGMGSPACLANTTSVSSVTKANAVSSFSNRNSLTDLFGVGTNINSLRATGTTLSSCTVIDATKIRCSGTSMATPAVSGVAALFNQFLRQDGSRTFTPAQLQDALNDTGHLVDDSGGTGLHYRRANLFSAISTYETLPPTLTVVFPLNNSYQTNFSFLVNLSSSETLDTAILEINNTNYTMSGGGDKWSVNITDLGNQTYTYLIYGNDTLGNMNNSPLYSVIIDSFPPFYQEYTQNTTQAQFNDTITINLTAYDTSQLSGYQFFWNDTGNFTNQTGTLFGQSTAVGLNMTVTASKGETVGFYLVINDSASHLNVTTTQTISVVNTPPLVQTVNIQSNDPLNRTNGSLTGQWSTMDADEDMMTDNQTLWYNGSVLFSSLENLTSISPQNFSKNENWTFSVRVFDGTNWSEFKNTTITIANALPDFQLDNQQIGFETILFNLTLNATDNDTDTVAFSINKSEASIQAGHLVWTPNLTDAGLHHLNITADDGQGQSYLLLNLTVEDTRDTDGDGNPDYNDTDDDNDNLNDTVDFLVGNLSNLNASSALDINLTINGSTNLSQLFNGSLIINISSSVLSTPQTILSFSFVFNETSVLDLSNITINYSATGSSGVSIQGVTRPSANFSKTAYLPKKNSTVTSVCIKDRSTSLDSISSSCTEDDEILVSCNNVSSQGYTCLAETSQYVITGLNHSAVKELCRDNDGDGYGVGCTLGTDCDDADNTKTTSCSSSSSSSSGGGGGGGGGGSGGGGGPSVSNSDKSAKFFSSVDQGQPASMEVSTTAVSRITFIPNKEVNSVTLTVESTNSTSSPPGIAHSYIEIHADPLTSQDFEQVTIEFSVEKSWIDDQKVNDSTIILYRYAQRWISLPTELVSSSTNLMNYRAFSSGFSLFAIAGMELSEPVSAPPVNQSEKDNPDESEDTTEEVTIQSPEIESSNIGLVVFTVLTLIILFVVVTVCAAGIIKSRKKKQHKHHHNHHEESTLPKTLPSLHLRHKHKKHTHHHSQTHHSRRK